MVTRRLGALFALWTALMTPAWAADTSHASGTPSSGRPSPDTGPVTSDAAPSSNAGQGESDSELIRNLDLIENLDLLDTIDALKALGTTDTDEEAF
jgi:hypothetical protein